jgi:hypothetical protein
MEMFGQSPGHGTAENSEHDAYTVCGNGETTASQLPAQAREPVAVPSSMTVKGNTRGSCI